MNTFASILVDTDATAFAQPALHRAANLARKCGARLRIVDVMSAPAERAPRADLEDELMTRRREQLARIAYGLRDLMVDTEVLAGPPADALIKDVECFGHDLVVRSHVRDLVARRPQAFGPIDAQLFRRCPCPVWAIGPGVAPEHHRIAAAVDVCMDDPATQRLNARIVDMALLLNQLQEGSLLLVHAWQPVAEKRVATHVSDDEYSAYVDSSRHGAKRKLATLVESFADRLAGTQLELRRGRVDDVIPEFVVAEGIDLVVMGTQARTGIAGRLFGNTAERLLTRLPCSIVVVKSSERTSLARGDAPEPHM